MHSAIENLQSGQLEGRERKKIIEYQKMAFHCFVRASKMGSGDESLWASFSTLNMTILSQPMNGDALNSDSQSIQPLMNALAAGKKADTSLASSGKVKVDMVALSEYLFGITAYCLKKAIKANPGSWDHYYNLAHVYRKLDCQPELVVSTFMKAFQKMRKDLKKDMEKAAGPISKFFSYLLKSGLAGSLHIAEITSHVEELGKIFAPLCDAFEAYSPMATPPDISSGECEILVRMKHLFLLLAKLDKRKWQHKPIYNLACIEFKMGDIISAKEHLIQLTQLRSPSKAFKGIWKTEFERPGAYFVYTQKYCNLLLGIATKTKDLNLLGLLAQRLSKDEVLFKRQAALSECKKAINQLLEAALLGELDSFEKFCHSIDMTDLTSAESLAIADKSLFPALVVACDMKRTRILEIDSLIVRIYCQLMLNYGPRVSVASNLDDNAKAKLIPKSLGRALAITRNIEIDKT